MAGSGGFFTGSSRGEKLENKPQPRSSSYKTAIIHLAVICAAAWHNLSIGRKTMRNNRRERLGIGLCDITWAMM
jgi:hypothetical protein